MVTTFPRFLAVGAAMFALMDLAQAQECSMGPKCAVANSKAESYMTSLPPSVGTNDSATQSYCVNMVAAELASFCAAELQQMGRPDCASLAEQQAAANKDAASQALGVAAASASASEWHPKCGWE